MNLAGILTVRADAPLQPDRGLARSWAQQELLRPEYQAERPGPLELFVDWLGRQLERLPAPGGINIGVGLTVVIMLVLALIGYVLWKSGGVHSRARTPVGEVFDALPRTADEHRRAAASAEAAGDLRTALLELFRALARSLDERALVELVPGLTADELALRAAARLPGLAASFTAAARAFDDVRYGDRPATATGIGMMRDLDHRAGRAAPVPAGDSGGVGGALAVPR